MEVIQQRLERESDIDLVQTAPTVRYRVKLTNGEEKEVRSPSELPDGSVIADYLEPIAHVNVVVPAEYIGAVMKICTDRRGQYQKTDYYGRERVMIGFRIPVRRDHLRLPRPPEVGDARLRHDGLRGRGLRGQQPGQGAHPDRRRRGRRAVVPATRTSPRAAAARS
jgi:hypothetical protein